MSRAFVKEDAAGEEPVLPVRAPLPDGAVNYVTPRGLQLLRQERDELGPALAATEDTATRTTLQHRMAELDLRLSSARVIDLRDNPPNNVRFGATVTIRKLNAAQDAEITVKIVGVDEADAASDRISLYSPLAQALLGRGPGERLQLSTDHGPVEFEIVSFAYAD